MKDVVRGYSVRHDSTELAEVRQIKLQRPSEAGRGVTLATDYNINIARNADVSTVLDMTNAALGMTHSPRPKVICNPSAALPSIMLRASRTGFAF